MTNFAKRFSLAVVCASLSACAATQNSVETQSSSNVAVVATAVIDASASMPDPDKPLTLTQIMADPDWIGREPEDAYWGSDSTTVYYQQKQQGSPIKDLFKTHINDTTNGQKVALSELHTAGDDGAVYNQQRNVKAWRFEGNLFVELLDSGEIRQLTRDQQSPHNLQFLLDGRLSYQSGDRFFAIDVYSGMTELLAHWTFKDEPKANEDPQDFIAKEQVALIDYVALQRTQREQRFAKRQQILKENPTTVPEPFYLPASHRTVEASLSPNGRWLIVSETEDKPSRSDGDIMPNYIGEDGRIKPEKVRQRVADAKPQDQSLWLMDLQRGEKRSLSYQTLPGFNEDVLADVKRENAEARGETYQANRLPREIGLMVDWYWDQSAIQWHSNGSTVAIMLEAWDNKDRWIATVDFKQGQLVSQHRLHDEAWINYKFNSFGWLNNSATLWYLSEHSGYAHLYTQVPGAKPKALTSGRYEVDEITLTHDDSYFYFQANIKHPGIYEIYRVAASGGEIQAQTDLNGYTDYVLSPDEQHLLLTHSKLTQPPELYHARVGGNQPVARLTHTVSEAFAQIDWQAPAIVPVASSHTQQPIFSRVYYPQNVEQGEKRRAVIFNHGAGYLQNAHLGWSGYFREFMFHNMLAQQGYVVMDMDYRASMGYGRDWRTAIYRQMGTPEIQDLRDGVNWLVENANVDRGRIGTYGGSYGGFMTFMALFTAPDLFEAGAALRPVTDWAHYNLPYTSNILNLPDIDPIAYRRSSPLYFAEGLEDPLLINAPMVDDNVFFVDVVRLVQRLIELEKENFETAIYPVEPHGFVQPSSWLDEYRRIYKLFEQEL
ncbi:prolyl oligopeptidase family serine peptidase [Aestuariibacter halophilus]|uniref:Prolyl oligopeptidase family serine peptidase n=1 Tax=Fluctibacter halophilus TaxID=226011 RepID=A0ABS8G586_9ALTE|nr:prolyl oligopeptidase family serine peptidase [Aestuariibacter halophilus]MCC2615764.1 prolyl oligopeptidase family serine peptidase [Aestuariibacter halophilus]